MSLPLQSPGVARGATSAPVIGGVQAQCNIFQCGGAIISCIAQCGTNPSCYLTCLGPLCKSCCSCIPVVGPIVCGLCPG